MPASFLLIDGDDEFRRRLAAILTSGGSEVLEASTKEEANAAVSSTRVDFVVIDGKTVGETAEQLISQFTNNANVGQIAFLSRGSGAHHPPDHRVRNLGAAMIAHKPMPPEELAHKITSLLELTEISEAASSETELQLDAPDYPREAQLENLRNNYMKKIPELLKQIGQLLVDAQDSADSTEHLNDAYRLAHTLNGTAGSLGFSEVCSVAHAMEGVLKEIAHMRKITSIPPADYLGLNLPPEYKTESRKPTTPIESIEHKRAAITTSVLVVDNDPAFLESVTAMGRDNLIHVHTASTRDEALEQTKRHRLDAAIIDIHLASEENAFQIAQDLRSLDGYSELTIAFTSADTSIPTRIAAVHAGSSHFLDKPMQGTEFAAAVRRLAPVEFLDQPRIFVVDDDEDFLKYVSHTLEVERMKVDTLSDPTRVLEIIQDKRPDLMLLDVVMPEISGFDICRVLRSTEQWRDLPILFLTVHAGNEVLLRCFESGGDDYIVKPALREELLARINIRLDRVRLFRERADRDGLTSLPTRRAFIDQLKVRMSEAKRFNKPLAMCLLDLDYFKSINDTYGHLAGDRVLASFGHLLGSRFRVMDVRGRWGGEEFVVAFYGEESETAKMIIRRVQEEFSEMVFRGDHGEKFRVSFSAGIASFPGDGSAFEDLFKVVDEKLYVAKKEGRNRVVV
ncbi:MAG: response regulator [Deltaproteobacteria bacterium]|nr:response regulator [Deltaproteobacteria bacterium]